MTSIVFWSSLVLFTSSWFLYPLALTAIRVFVRRYEDSWNEPDEWPSVSILLSARNEENVIKDRITNLLSQEYDGPLEIVVGSDSSEDSTDEIVESFRESKVILHRSSTRIGKPRMIQELIPISSGDVIVMTDSDTVFVPGTVKQLVLPYSRPKVGCVDGCRRNSLEDETCESAYWKYEKGMKRICSSMGAVLGATGAVFSIRREAFFPLSEGRADDFELAVMARIHGYDCVYSGGAVAMEPSPEDSVQFKRMVRIVSWMFTSGLLLFARALGRGRIFLSFQLLLHKLLRWLSGFFLMVATISAGLLSTKSFYMAIFLLLCAFHAFALIGFMLGKRLPSKVLIPYYFWLMNMASFVGILRTLSGKPVEVWDSGKAAQAE